MWTLVWTVFAASVVGSLHCAGMCGGLVAFAVGSPPSGRAGTPSIVARQAVAAASGYPWKVLAERWLAAHLGVHTAYHGGRLVAYVLLGALAGTLGRGVDLAGQSHGWSAAAAVIAGAAMVAWGGWGLLAAAGVRMPRAPRWPGLSAAYAATVGTLRARPAGVRAGVLGLASALLPCGWLYAFVVTAAGTGSTAGGALAMTAFWAGTLPMLATLGAGVQSLAGPLRQHQPKVAAAALVVVGALAIVQRAPPWVPATSSSAACCHGR